MANWDASTELQVTLDGVDLTLAGRVPTLFQQSVASGNISKTLVLTNNGGSDITSVSISRSNWSYNMEAASFPTQPFTIPALGFTASGVVRTHTWPLLSSPLPSIYYARFTVNYTEDSTAKSLWFEVVMILQDPNGNPSNTPTESEFYDMIYDAYFVSSSGTGPNGFGWGLENEGFGYVDFFETFMPTMVSNGVKKVMLHLIHGNFQDSGQLSMNAWPRLQEWATSNNRPELITSWIPALDYADSLNIKLLLYYGCPSTAQEFLDEVNNGTADSCLQLLLSCIGWGLGRTNIEFGFDSPYNDDEVGNPLQEPGEPRYDFLKAVADIKALQGNATLLEPRGTSAQTWWHAAAGFGRIMYMGGWARNNPAWYGDASTATTDAQMAGERIVIMQQDGSTELLPYMAAQAIYEGLHMSLGVTYLWITDGGTGTTLYNAAKTLLETVEGSGL